MPRRSDYHEQLHELLTRLQNEADKLSAALAAENRARIARVHAASLHQSRPAERQAA